MRGLVVVALGGVALVSWGSVPPATSAQPAPQAAQRPQPAVTPIPVPELLRGTVHPYYAPDCYANGEIRIEWWHWLSRDYFVHSNQCWYSLQYGITTDTELQTFHDLRAIFNYDVNSCLSVGAQAQAYLGGDVYTQYSAMAFLQVRFLGK